MRKTLYLIRHGQASAGTENYDRLSPLGAQQSKLLGQHMRDEKPLPAEIWSGSLLRQQQTAQHFIDGSGLSLPVRTDERLNEYDHRTIHSLYHPPVAKSDTHPRDDKTDLSIDMSFEHYSQIILNWSNGDGLQDAISPQFGGKSVETWVQFKQRCLAAMLDIARQSEHETIALFTSGGVISVIAAQLEQRHDKDIPLLIWGLDNTSVNTVHLEVENSTLMGLNQVPHLEFDPTLKSKI